MELFPYYLAFALVCFVLSIGLQRRTIWMWYLGWVILYLAAGYVGQFFFTALYFAANPAMEGFAFVYLLGGLVLWMPATIWWATHRHLFGANGRALSKSTKDIAKAPGS